MSEIAGWRWAVVVFGPIALLVALVALVYVGLFVVPGAPCGGEQAVEPPTGEFTISTNGSAVTATYVGDETLESPGTDRIVLSVRNAESPDAVSREWVGDGHILSPGDSVTIPADEIGFRLSGQDRATVQWYGSDPDQPGICPNDNRFAELTAVRLANASAGDR